MTDERIDDRLFEALARLPRGAGVVFRHHATPLPQRRALLKRVRAVARRRRLVLIVAGAPTGVRCDGVHGARARRGHGLLTRPVHNLREAVAARRVGADAVFVSPVFATRSHPGGRALGRLGFAALAQVTQGPALALGGMTSTRFRSLRSVGAYGWAAIDAWSGGTPHPI